MECSFTPKHYLESLNLAQDAGFLVSPVSEFDKFKPSDKVLLLRHDVDLSLDLALDMALLEKDNGIRSTYYILLHSNLYNAMSPDGVEKVREIRKASHEVGLHVDTRCFLGPMEFEILSQIAQTTVSSWCRHLVTITPDLDMPHCAHHVDKLGYKYLSDSGMNWRERCLCQNLEKYNKLHVLIHPEWSMTGGKTKWENMERLEELARSQVSRSFRSFKDLVREYEQVINFHSLAKRTPNIS